MAEQGSHHPLDDRCDEALIQIYRQQSPATKFAVVDALWQSAVRFVRAGVQSQHPEWDASEVEREVARRMAARDGGR